MTTSPGGDSGSRGIVLARIGEQMFVTSLHLADSGLVLNFSAPNTETESQDAKRTGYITISKNPTQEFFRVLNPGNEKVSLVRGRKSLPRGV